MKKYLLIATALVALASCSDDTFVGENSPNTNDTYGGEIVFSSNMQKQTRAGEFVGATAAEKLGGMFVVEGTKGSEQTNSPSTDVVFDNYLVGYEYNSAGTTKSNTNNWEYVGLEKGITGKLSEDNWKALHPSGKAQVQSIKYWDYTQDQYDFIAWSTGKREAVTTAPTSGSSVKVTRINTGSTLSTDGFTLTALSADDLLECYYTDINTVTKASGGYGKPVTLTFRNMAAKVRVALYETVPGYSVKDVKFYTSDANPTAPTDLGDGTVSAATLFTMGDGNELPQSGEVVVYYPHIGKNHRDATPAQTKDYNKASVTVNPATGGDKLSTQAFGNLANFVTKEHYEATGDYLGRNITEVTYAGDVNKSYYTAVVPNTNGKPLTLRLDYTLVSTDGSGEAIKVYGAKAVVPSTYTVWQPNYAYTYIFKISDNSNGWTSQTSTDPQGLFPITFDAVVTSFIDANAEQTTVTTVATPSITTYQQGHDVIAPDPAYNEYSKSQKAGVSSDVKDVYVQVMDNSFDGSPTPTTPTLKADLNGTGKSLLFLVSKSNASEAEVMDALQNRTNEPTGEGTKAAYKDDSPVGRNGITLTKNTNIDNTVTEIINGVDDQKITKIAGTDIAKGQVAKIDIDKLTADKTYAYVYCSTVPSSEKKVYNVVSISTDDDAKKYYEIDPSANMSTTACTAGTKAVDGNVYFVKNVDAKGNFVSWTFKQTKVGDDVEGLYVATIPTNKANTYTASHFYFDVYYQNNGEYAVKVIKVVD